MIEVKNLNMSYRKRQVLKNVSFQIKDGTSVGLLGVNGAGKSTMLNLLTGYLKPTSGEIRINQADMRKDPKKAKQNIGYLPEIPPLYQDMKIREYLLFAAKLKGISNRGTEVDRIMQRLNIMDHQWDFLKTLSKDLQQSVSFAQALLGDPPVLILDEPLAGLNPTEAKNTRTLIQDLRKSHIILLSSRMLKEIEELCDEILILKDGEIILNDFTLSAKRKGSQNVYRLTIKGQKEIIQDCLVQHESLQEIQYVREIENGIYEFLGKARNSRDIRDSIWGYLVNKRLNVYSIDKVESSLEDVFMEINSREES